MQPINQTISNLVNQANPSGQPKESDLSQNMKRKHSPSEMAQLAKVLTVICAMQKQYGKTQAELETLVEGYSMILAHRSMEQIITAIQQYVLTNPDIPAPADIENIINPPEPRIDWALYIELKKRLRENVYVDRDEKAFIANCENLAVIRQKREMEGYTEAKRQLDNHAEKLRIEYAQ